jgi:hypothetical protein
VKDGLDSTDSIVVVTDGDSTGDDSVGLFDAVSVVDCVVLADSTGDSNGLADGDSGDSTGVAD